MGLIDYFAGIFHDRTPESDLDRYVGRGICSEWHRVGSRVTCDPAPSGTDEDFLLRVSEGDAFFHAASKDGFVRGGSELPDPNPESGHPIFSSYRRGNVNLIATSSEDFFRRFLAASSVAKRLNLLKKADRIALFQAVLYGNIWEESSLG